MPETRTPILGDTIKQTTFSTVKAEQLPGYEQDIDTEIYTDETEGYGQTVITEIELTVV